MNHSSPFAISNLYANHRQPPSAKDTIIVELLESIALLETERGTRGSHNITLRVDS